MNTKFAKIVLPAVLSIGTVGATALATTASAATTTTVKHAKTAVKKKAPVAKAPVTLSGTVVKAETTKYAFWFKVGAKTFRVSYSAKTPIAKGTAASLTKGKTVTVKGIELGKAGSVIRAINITA
ncbi:MAG: hypothetical protein ACYDEH_06850 [Acidimicrobiales bacterium]